MYVGSTSFIRFKQLKSLENICCVLFTIFSAVWVFSFGQKIGYSFFTFCHWTWTDRLVNTSDEKSLSLKMLDSLLSSLILNTETEVSLRTKRGVIIQQNKTFHRSSRSPCFPCTVFIPKRTHKTERVPPNILYSNFDGSSM